ncbi:sensor histidine kinase [Oceanibacterium hippocampi]|uniref:histidine kinase n=1 Tax=Oceanibacterium hippocampi TaxID=745714 RepID=A0A1Y5TFD4_9PROT|nr:ATP-binding protein [Oceanibacterium hippocampi]SLN62554.1 putative sensor-like histidine kinase YedV [Oceanibacterium hippocampi]
MLTRLLRTSGFQVAVLYVLLLGVTLVALLGFIYWSTSSLIDAQLNETIEAEIRGLDEQYRAEGIGRLVEVIAERSGPRGGGDGVYGLATPGFAMLAGNLTAWPREASAADGWRELSLARNLNGATTRHVVRGRVFVLKGGYHLFVGRDTAERSLFKEIMINAIVWALLPALALGLLGSVLIGRYALRRVDAVRATSEEILAGDLTRRVPLAGSGDEFDRLAETINRMLEQSETLMTGMRTVTDSLAHDLRSPLTRAKTGIELALRRESDIATYRQTLEQTNGELETILRTFEALISIAHAETGMNRLADSSLDLSQLLGDLADLYQPMAEEAGRVLVGEVAPGIMIRGHRELLGQAVANLIDNAIKFTPEGGEIRVVLGREGDTAVLAVADSGPGIPAADRERVLQRFVRLDASRGTPGSGLGLSLVAAVARLHGAALALADNEPGLRVILRLPLA